MGRGLGQQQRRVLDFAAAVNAYRNGGAPQPAPLLRDAWHVKTRDRLVLADAVPDVTPDTLLIGVAGFDPVLGPGLVTRRQHVRHYQLGESLDIGAVSYVTAHGKKWRHRPGGHSRQVSVMRAVNSLSARGLLAFNCGPRRWRCFPASLATSELSSPVAQYWDRNYCGWGWHVTAEGLAVAGDGWRQITTRRIAEVLRTQRALDRASTLNQGSPEVRAAADQLLPAG